MPSNLVLPVVFIIAVIVAGAWMMNMYREVAVAVGLTLILLVIVTSGGSPKRKKNRKRLSDIDDPYV
jgi:hypothetical protein